MIRSSTSGVQPRYHAPSGGADRYGAVLANLQAVGLSPVEAALICEPSSFSRSFKVLPGLEAQLAVRAF